MEGAIPIAWNSGKGGRLFQGKLCLSILLGRAIDGRHGGRSSGIAAGNTRKSKIDLKSQDISLLP